MAASPRSTGCSRVWRGFAVHVLSAQHRQPIRLDAEDVGGQPLFCQTCDRTRSNHRATSARGTCGSIAVAGRMGKTGDKARRFWRLCHPEGGRILFCPEPSFSKDLSRRALRAVALPRQPGRCRPRSAAHLMLVNRRGLPRLRGSPRRIPPNRDIRLSLCILILNDALSPFASMSTGQREARRPWWSR